MTPARGIAALVQALALALLVAIAWVLLVAPPRWSALLLVGDDAGYYFAIARNACLGYGPSFDRVHATNGFNPLFTLLLIGFDAALAPRSGLLDCYRAGLLASLIALLAGDRRVLALAGVLAFYVFFIVPKKQVGMDAALVLGLGTFTLDRVLRGGLLAPGGRAALADGLLLGLLVLARVDNLPLLVAAFGLMGLMVLTRAAPARALLLRLFWVALVVAPYVLWSTRVFGTWMPVSARIKSSFPHVDPAASLAAIRHTSVNAVDLASFLIAYAASWIVLGIGLRRLAGPAPLARLGALLREPRSVLLALLALTLVMRFTYMLGFSRVDVQGGYVMLAHVFNLLVFFEAIALVARRAPARAPRLAAAAALLLIAGSFGLFAGKAAGMARALHGPGLDDEWTLGREIHDATGPQDVLYGGAFGLTGFFADRAWINGDGVANSYDYQRAFAGDRLAAWLKASGVTHVVWATADRDLPPGPVRLDVEGVLAGRINSIVVDPRAIVLEGRLARGVTHGRGGSRVYVARWGR